MAVAVPIWRAFEICRQLRPCARRRATSSRPTEHLGRPDRPERLSPSLMCHTLKRSGRVGQMGHRIEAVDIESAEENSYVPQYLRSAPPPFLSAPSLPRLCPTAKTRRTADFSMRRESSPQLPQSFSLGRLASVGAVENGAGDDVASRPAHLRQCSFGGLMRRT
jgi:hypothetical protein